MRRCEKRPRSARRDEEYGLSIMILMRPYHNPVVLHAAQKMLRDAAVDDDRRVVELLESTSPLAAR